GAGTSRRAYNYRAREELLGPKNGGRRRTVGWGLVLPTNRERLARNWAQGMGFCVPYDPSPTGRHIRPPVGLRSAIALACNCQERRSAAIVSHSDRVWPRAIDQRKERTYGDAV